MDAIYCTEPADPRSPSPCLLTSVERWFSEKRGAWRGMEGKRLLLDFEGACSRPNSSQETQVGFLKKEEPVWTPGAKGERAKD